MPLAGCFFVPQLPKRWQHGRIGTKPGQSRVEILCATSCDRTGAEVRSYIQLTEAEEAFRLHKSDLVICHRVKGSLDLELRPLRQFR
jgi:hypothetical protein